MRTPLSLTCLASIPALIGSLLVGCVDESEPVVQETTVQTKIAEPFSLTADEIDLLAECQGHEEFFATGVEADDELGRLFVNAYRQASTLVPTEKRRQYE